MMKKIVVLPLLMLIAFSASSQVEWLVFAGPQATNTSYKVAGTKQESEFKYGFHVGVGLKAPFEGRICFAPAAFYSLKGYKVAFTQFAYPPDVNAIDNNTTIHCFELAALLQIDLGKDKGHPFIKAGPSLDFQLFGKETYTLKNNGGTVSRNMKWGPGEYGHYSANMLLQFGYETSGGFTIFGQYTHGMASLNNHDGGPAIRHRVFGLSLGKYLNRKKIVMDTRNKE